MNRNKALLPLLLIFAFTAFSQTLPQGVQKITSVEGITEYALPNGLHVLLFPDASKPKVTVNMTYLVGSRHEGYGETGMAHLLEHMLFKHTKTAQGRQAGAHGPRRRLERHHLLGPHQLLRDPQRHRREPQVGPSSSKPTAWSTCKIEKPLLDTEMTVVRNEFEMGENSPDRILDAARARGRLHLAQLRQAPPSATAPISSMCRSTGWPRSTRSTTSPTTRC